MRHRSEEQAPNKEEIDRIIGQGASLGDKKRFYEFLRRLRKACFLDKDNKRLSSFERLIALYKKDGLVLFLGAGVTKDSDIPRWSKLADKVLLECVLKKPKDENGELKGLKKALPSYEAQFELARQSMQTHKDFVKAIYEALYPAGMKCREQLKKIPVPFKEQKRWPEWGNVLESLQANKTLQAVGDLLIIGGDKRWKHNPQIHAVLTTSTTYLSSIALRKPEVDAL